MCIILMSRKAVDAGIVFAPAKTITELLKELQGRLEGERGGSTES